MTGSGLKGTGGGGGGGAPQSSSSDFSSSESGEAARGGTELLITEGIAEVSGTGAAGADGGLIVAEAEGGLGAAAERSLDVTGIDGLGTGGIARLPVGAGDITLSMDAVVQDLA